MPEPVTETEYRARLRELRDERLVLAEAAAYVAEVWAEGAWAETGEEVSVSRAAVVRELKRAIGSGDLPVEQRGRRRVVTMGALADWLGQELAPIPAFGMGMVQRPDRETEFVDRQRDAHAWAQVFLARARRLVGPASAIVDESPSLADDLHEALVRDLNAVWGEFLACEQVARQERAALGSDKSLDPDIRNIVKETRDLLVEVSDGLAQWDVTARRRDPDMRLVMALGACIQGLN